MPLIFKVSPVCALPLVLCGSRVTCGDSSSQTFSEVSTCRLEVQLEGKRHKDKARGEVEDNARRQTCDIIRCSFPLL